jgi:hypothetical protein
VEPGLGKPAATGLSADASTGRVNKPADDQGASLSD